MATQRQAARAALWRTIERAATQGVSFVVILLLARLLGPANYGLVAMAATIALLGQTLLGETFSEALIQAKTLEPAHISSLFWMLFGFGLLTAGIVFLAADELADLFGMAGLAAILRALCPLLILTALQAVPAAIFKRNLDFRTLAAASMSGTVLGGVAGVGMAFAGYGPWSLVANLLVQNAMVTAAIWRQSSFRPQFLYSHRHVRDLWSYGQYTFLLRIAAFASNQGPRILVGYLFGAASLGAFALALRIVENMFQLLTLPAANVMVPVVAKIRDEPKRLERAILGATALSTAIAVPAFVGFAFIAPTAVPLLFGSHWSQSAAIVQILSLVGVSNSIGQINRSIIAGLGRPAINLAMNTTAAVANIALVLVTAPWGLTVTAIAFVIRSYVVLPTLPLVIARLTGIRLITQIGVYGPIILAAAVMAVSVEMLIRGIGGVLSPLALTAAATGFGAAMYILALYLFARPALRLGISVLADLRPSQNPA